MNNNTQKALNFLKKLAQKKGLRLFVDKGMGSYKVCRVGNAQPVATGILNQKYIQKGIDKLNTL